MGRLESEAGKFQKALWQSGMNKEVEGEDKYITYTSHAPVHTHTHQHHHHHNNTEDLFKT